uniref:Hist_deacetyl domain-containing protein n=1 Tax=Panagrellus redivivus TaxID=6233 RepID=A0A7E4V6Q9_PANRE
MAPTFYVTDPLMLKHKCEWDSAHVEQPLRLSSITDRITATGLASKCIRLASRTATVEEILTVHTQKYYDVIKGTQNMDLESLEALSSTFEDLYLNQHSYNSAMLSAGCALTALDAVLKTEGSNGFAAIRPPGHHAAPDAGCGFCIFNNVAICAKEARKRGLERVLIIDWDVHAGQGTQYCIEGDPGIKLVSIHRYEDGCFWPNLPESGIEQPYSNTINVPLDVPGYGNFEYAAFIDMFIRPIIADYKPELILVSCGFDAGFGDRLGKMEVTPAGYGYMTGTLASLGIPLLLLQEGGYFIDALPYHAERTVQALIERKPLNLPLTIDDKASLNSQFLRQLFGAMDQYRKEFPTFQIILNQFKELHPSGFNFIISTYKGVREFDGPPYPTRGSYPPFADLEKFQSELHNVILPPYQHPEKREHLEVQINTENGGVSFIRSNDKGKTPVATIIPTADGLSRSKQVLFCYYLVYLPLTWTFSINSWEDVSKILHTVKGSHDDTLKISSESGSVLNFLGNGF